MGSLRRYHNVLFPVTLYVCELLPETARDSTRVELHYEGARFNYRALQPQLYPPYLQWFRWMFSNIACTGLPLRCSRKA